MDKKKIIWFLSLVAAVFATEPAYVGALSLPELTPPQSGPLPLALSPQPPSAVVTGVAPESPFFFFRRLMKMTSEECQVALKEHPPHIRKAICDKVTEYKEMPSQECERSLQILDLRWYLFCGVDIQSDMLEKYIDSVPEDYREIIRERLDRWFSIPRQHRTNILANVKNFPFPRQAQGSVGQGGGGGMTPWNGPRRLQKPFDGRSNNIPFPEKGALGMPFSPQGFPFFLPGRPMHQGGPFFGRGWRGGGAQGYGFHFEAPERQSPFSFPGTNSSAFAELPRTNKGRPLPPPGEQKPSSGSDRDVLGNSVPQGLPPLPGRSGRGGGPGWAMPPPGPKAPMHPGATPGSGMSPNAGPDRGGRWGGFDQFRDVREKKAWEELNNFFSMSPHERDRVLRLLPRESREKTRRVMKMLDDLPPVERQNSLKILLQISDLPQDERSAYVHSAERWNSLSEEEKRFFKILFMPSSPLPEMPPLPSEVKVKNHSQDTVQ